MRRELFKCNLCKCAMNKCQDLEDTYQEVDKLLEKLDIIKALLSDDNKAPTCKLQKIREVVSE